MNRPVVTIGDESSDEEYQAIQDIFGSYKIPYTVDSNYRRLAYDQLPMVVMILAQNVAGNVIWDLIKYTYGKVLSDKRLDKRKPTIVIKRGTYDAVITKDGFHVRSYEENLTFDNVDDLISYDEAKNKHERKNPNNKQ